MVDGVGGRSADRGRCRQGRHPEGIRQIQRYLDVRLPRKRGNEGAGRGFKNSKLVLMGGKWTFTQGTAESKGTFKVDLTQKPKTIDITFTEGPEKGKTVLGIYELEGDTYKLCLSLKDKDRPKEFVSKAGSGHILE